MPAEGNIQQEGLAPERHVLGRPIVYRVGTWGIGYLPRAVSYWCVRRIAEVSWLLCKNARKNVCVNLRRVFPALPPRLISAKSLDTFRNYSMYLVDYGRFSSVDESTIGRAVREVSGMERVQAALKEGRGAIVLTAHLGNWELGAVYFARRGIKVNVVTFRDGIDRIDEIRERYRTEHNIKTIILGDSPFATVELLNALRRNELVAMLVDRPSAGLGGSIRVGFFGRPFDLAAGPFLLSRMTGAPILPAFLVRERGTYRSVVEAPIVVPEDGALEPHG